MSRFVTLLLLALGLVAAVPALAQQEQSTAPYAYRQLDDPAEEEKAQALMETLRCLQCQGQSIADSDAPIAGSMRSLVRERIAAGEQPEAIRGWLIERYGDYVSYAPRITSLTWPLFAVPAVLVLLAFLLLRRRFTGKSGQGEEA
ncbi:cytochrome c-type biogenesis protein [Novosphingobium mangrovi (ex Huang et al. 2023)]|uniref:Cytochrome c-type biogenesis protein n=1 Tax=Novosphingobium mangrovi (ex Huang et al. 2023) TaxID=2976432 RepID=A0ABT2I6X2_9SPHN|nr:cytochrome c-type biogenesis protein [Novosphingobium mangrovi (ex Huang et al. 2023)]MCT2400570.1 cytochrome c-type biogenesis protein CcmH [Novosphingobium mangrovi (ex Huang et al. 2023)]